MHTENWNSGESREIEFTSGLDIKSVFLKRSLLFAVKSNMEVMVYNASTEIHHAKIELGCCIVPVSNLHSHFLLRQHNRIRISEACPRMSRVISVGNLDVDTVPAEPMVAARASQSLRMVWLQDSTVKSVSYSWPDRDGK